MARTDSNIRITPSVLDRLIDYDPRESRESPKSRSASLMELKASVRRDLESFSDLDRVQRLLIFLEPVHAVAID